MQVTAFLKKRQQIRTPDLFPCFIKEVSVKTHTSLSVTVDRQSMAQDTQELSPARTRCFLPGNEPLANFLWMISRTPRPSPEAVCVSSRKRNPILSSSIPWLVSSLVL